MSHADRSGAAERPGHADRGTGFAVPAALASAAATGVLWGIGADTAAVLLAEAGLLVTMAMGRVWVRPADRFPGAVAASGPARPEPAPDREPQALASVGIARRIQATVNQELHDLRQMQDRHGDAPEVFGDLLRLDHGVSLIGRLADSLAVLGGAGSGRRRTRPVDLLDVVRGAMSRIVEYPRVDVDVPGAVAITAGAVEPVVHALAELLDNATRYSPPDTRVSVSAERRAGGDLAIVVEDAGVGLNTATYREICRILSPSRRQNEPDPVPAGGPPRLGLVVVGRLARGAGFEAVVRPGERGGTRALLQLPAGLVTSPGAGGSAAGSDPAPDPANARRPGPRPSGSWDAKSVGPTGLPQRRRHAATPPTAAPVVPDTHPTAQRAGAGQWLGAFMGERDGGRK